MSPSLFIDRTLGFLVADLARLLRRSMDRRLQSLGLTQAQWRAIVHLSRSEGITQAMLAEALEIQPITLTRLIDRMEPELSPDIVLALRRTLTRMDDGTPCPAPHVSVGSWSVGALAATMAVRVLRGDAITPAPRMVFLNLDRYCTTPGIDML